MAQGFTADDYADPEPNIGNLRDPSTGDFAAFDSPYHGLCAMRSDIATKISGVGQPWQASTEMTIRITVQPAQRLCSFI